MYEEDLVSDHLYHTNRLLITKRGPPEVSLCTFKPVSRTIFQTCSDKRQNLFRMKLTTDVTLPFVSAVNNDIFVYFCVTPVDYQIT